MKKRLNLVLSVVVLLSLFLTACSGGQPATNGEQTDSTSSPETADGSVELRIVTMFGGTDPVTSVLRDVLQEFENQNPGIKIINDSMTAGDAFNTKVSTDFSSGNEPEIVFYFNGANATSFVEAGKVIPMEELLDADQEWKEGFHEAALEQMKEKDGKLYAIPVNGFYEGLIVNKAMFDEYGIALPTDWATYEKAISAFKEKGIIPIGQSLPESWYLIEHYLMAAGGPAGHQNPFDDSWKKGLEVIQKHAEMGAFPIDANTIDDATAQHLFDTEQAAMMINGSWAVGGLSEEMQEKVVVLPIPAMEGSTGTGQDVIGGFSAGFYITTKAYESPKKEAAIQLLKFLTSKENIQKYATANGGPPAAKVTVEA
ncbi:ABC transporter substrate-binding protein [Caldalkalibacillus mannanilyticus]|uniref:ABC transporter substrate-binding protein n=1 Tax=Caldalkalibacillus mannanilyticus TaxID=1418 RepID=UPI000684D210|nr:extracellular solute-binding protein [Caldalkalibacillus mannanilyticus]